jgi:hypothetical protein
MKRSSKASASATIGVLGLQNHIYKPFWAGSDYGFE